MIALLVICVALALIAPIFNGLAMLRLAREIKEWRKIPIILPKSLPVVTTLPVTGLQGGALRVDLDDGTRVIWDIGDGAGPFANEVGVEMIATFQRIER